MPLKLTCSRCSAALMLHDAFAGASCRCRFCGHVIDVPAPARAVARSVHRPARPRLKSEIAALKRHTPRAASAASAAASIGGAAAAVAVAKPKLFSLAALGAKWWMLSAAAALAVSTVAGVSLYRRAGGPPPIAPVVQPDEPSAFRFTDGVDTARIVRWPMPDKAIKTFISQPLNAGSLAWVIDGSQAMAPHFDRIAHLTSLAAMQLHPDSQRFGIYVATTDGVKSRGLAHSSKENYRTAKSVLESVTPGGQVDLLAAFSAAARQRPEQINVVVAQTLDPAVVADMRREATDVGSLVNVIVLGKDQKAFRRLAHATSGDYKVLDAKALNTWATLIAQNGTMSKLEKEYFER